MAISSSLTIDLVETSPKEFPVQAQSETTPVPSVARIKNLIIEMFRFLIWAKWSEAENKLQEIMESCLKASAAKQSDAAEISREGISALAVYKIYIDG